MIGIRESDGVGELVFQTMKLPDNVVVIGLEGPFDHDTENELMRAITEIQVGGTHHLVFNLSRLSALTSSGIGTFIKIVGSCREKGGNVVIVQPREPAVQEMLRLFGLVNCIDIVDNVNNAVKAILAPL